MTGEAARAEQTPVVPVATWPVARPDVPAVAARARWCRRPKRQRSWSWSLLVTGQRVSTLRRCEKLRVVVGDALDGLPDELGRRVRRAPSAGSNSGAVGTALVGRRGSRPGRSGDPVAVAAAVLQLAVGEATGGPSVDDCLRARPASAQPPPHTAGRAHVMPHAMVTGQHSARPDGRGCGVVVDREGARRHVSGNVAATSGNADAAAVRARRKSAGARPMPDVASWPVNRTDRMVEPLAAIGRPPEAGARVDGLGAVDADGDGTDGGVIRPSVLDLAVDLRPRVSTVKCLVAAVASVRLARDVVPVPLQDLAVVRYHELNTSGLGGSCR